MFVIVVAPTKENDTKKLLEQKGYTVLCPKKIKVERNKEVEKVIFSSYLFVDMNMINDRDYYKIKNTMNVIRFLDSKNTLSENDENYIRMLANGDKAIRNVKVYFDSNKKLVVYSNDENYMMNTKNIVRVNARDKTATFRVNFGDEVKNITLNYEEIQMAN